MLLLFAKNRAGYIYEASYSAGKADGAAEERARLREQVRGMKSYTLIPGWDILEKPPEGHGEWLKRDDVRIEVHHGFHSLDQSRCTRVSGSHSRKPGWSSRLSSLDLLDDSTGTIFRRRPARSISTGTPVLRI